MPVPEGTTRKIFIAGGAGSLGFLRVSTRSTRSYKSRAASPFFWLAITRLKKSGLAGPIAGVESGTTDCAAESATRAKDSSATEMKAPLSMRRSGERAANVHSRFDSHWYIIVVHRRNAGMYLWM